MGNALVSFALCVPAFHSVGCLKQEDARRSQVRPKNLILISMDTVRADHLGCYGYKRRTTPRIDAYAESGVVFENCTSSSSWTVPAHLTIFTSMEPATHRCIYYPNPDRLNENYETMAKIFTRHGFRTVAFTGGAYAGTVHGFEIGFERYESRGLRFEHNIEPALNWIERYGDRPFFMFLHGFNAHRPYVPPPPWNTRFAEPRPFDLYAFGPKTPRPGEDDLAYVIAQYDGEIAYVDHLLGYFLDTLRERNLLKDTLVIVTSDHGDEFYEHGRCDHIHTLYDELTQVPWIMFGPSMPAKRIPHHVGTIDILPTVLSLFDITVGTQFQGTDRSGLIFGGEAADDAAIFSYTGKSGQPKHLSSIRTARWKLVTDLPPGCPNTRCEKCKRGEPEGTNVWLFDLKADPWEQNNVGGKYPDVVQKLYGRLRTRLRQCDELRLAAEQPPPLTVEQLKALRSLGYVGHD